MAQMCRDCFRAISWESGECVSCGALPAEDVGDSDGLASGILGTFAIMLRALGNLAS